MSKTSENALEATRVHRMMLRVCQSLEADGPKDEENVLTSEKFHSLALGQ
jgi:hypothetical protein